MNLFDEKSELQTIDCNEIVTVMPDMKNYKNSKTKAIAEGLQKYLETTSKTGMLLPLKNELATALGVSTGTVQNAYRLLEDRGCVTSKQCFGTIVLDKDGVNNFPMRKQTSKRDMAIDLIKKMIKKNKLEINTTLPSVRQLSKIISIPPNTTGLAIELLESDGILQKTQNGIIILKTDFEVKHTNRSKTLVKKLESDLKKYIIETLKIGDKLPAHNELAEMFNVSIKTMHDSLNLLIKDGILLARRGRYGTSVIKMPSDSKLQPKKEMSIFASSQKTAFYHYEKIQNNIINLINEKYDIGSKLPSIAQTAKMMDVSPNTIRKAFTNLAEEGYLRFSRGRYGGTFIVDIPTSSETQAFKWLAVNPQYAAYQAN